MFEHPFVHGGTEQTHILMSSHLTVCDISVTILFVINPFYRELYQNFF